MLVPKQRKGEKMDGQDIGGLFLVFISMNLNVLELKSLLSVITNLYLKKGF